LLGYFNEFDAAWLIIVYELGCQEQQNQP